MELPILVNHLVQSVTSKERNPLQPHYECELLREVKAHLKIQNENLHPQTLAIAEDVIEQLIERFLGSAQAIAQHCFRMEVKVEDFEYSVESWLRNSVPQKLDLALNDWFLEFSSMTERYRILPESEDSEEDEDDESYTPSESDSDSIDSEVSAADSDADEELEDDFDMDEEEEDMEVDEDSEDFYDKLSPSQFSEQSNEDSNILNTSSNVDRRYESLSGDRLLHFRRYCQNLREHLVYCLIPDEVFISLHRFLFSQLYLSFQANPICLLTKGGFTPLGLLNHYLIASDSFREQKRTQSFIQDSIVKQRHSLYEEKEKSKDLLLTLQELIRTLKGIQSPSSSDKENQPIFQSPVYKRPISDPSATPVAPHTTSTVPTADLIPVHPHLLNSLARQLKESEEKVQQLQTQLVMQSQKKEVSKTNAPLTTKKEKKLKSLLSDLMRLVESEHDQGIETTVKKSSSSNILDDADMPTETFHRYPFGGSKELDESEEIDSKDLARKTTSEPNVNLLQRFQSTTSEELKVALLEDEDENAATTQTSSGIVFNSSKKRKYGFLESSDPQYMYGSPEWNEKIEAWQKRVRSQQPQQKGDEKNTTPSIFDRFK